jgi:hypothetical protein
VTRDAFAVRARRAREKFSNDWKKSFQWLENFGGFFQWLENFFPMVGKNGRIFPVIGKIFRAFSNDWKKFSGRGRRKVGARGEQEENAKDAKGVTQRTQRL